MELLGTLFNRTDTRGEGAMPPNITFDGHDKVDARPIQARPR